MKLFDSGARRIHFKDFGQEAPGSGDGALWEATTPGNWSIGLGAGALPTTFQGTGYRHLVTATTVRSRKYNVTPGANSWWDTDQTVSKQKYALTFDFGFRTTGYQTNGVAFGFLMEHTAFSESQGYRVRFTATGIVVERKSSGGAWVTLGTFSVSLNTNQDYYVRIVYIPQDFVMMDHEVEFAGYISVSITDSFVRRGQENIAAYFVKDTSPLLGSSTSKMMLEAVDSGTSAQFWGIIYAEPFLGRPAHFHYFASAKRIRQDLRIDYVMQTQEEYDWLKNGDRIEVWVNERYAFQNTITKVITNYNKSLCRFDGGIYKMDYEGSPGVVSMYCWDEFTYAFMTGSGHYEIDSGLTDYYGWLLGLVALYQGEKAYPQRVAGGACFEADGWGQAISYDYIYRGKFARMIRTITTMLQVWVYWDPATAWLVSQRAPIATGKVIDLEAAPGEETRVTVCIAIDSKRDNWFSKVIGYNEDGSGAIEENSDESTTDKATYGPSEDATVETNLPSAEGNLYVDNKYDQYKDKNKVIDIVCLAWGAELGIGGRMEIVDPSKNIDSIYYTIIEIEEFSSESNRRSGKINNLNRLRLSRQDGATPTVLPRYEESRNNLRTTTRKNLESEALNWT